MRWIFVVLMVGCATNEDTFWEQYAQVSCTRMHECLKGPFQAEWDDDISECVDDQMDDYEDAEDYYDDCDFDDDKARKCLEQTRSDSCGDLSEDGVDDCSEVYDCSDSDN